MPGGGSHGFLQPNPALLVDLDRKKKKSTLAHDLGAGMPCMKCKERCPGFQLHFWRKVCINCRCGKAEHNVVDEQDPGFYFVGKLFDRPLRTRAEELEFCYGDLDSSSSSSSDDDHLDPEERDRRRRKKLERRHRRRLLLSGSTSGMTSSSAAVHREQQQPGVKKVLVKMEWIPPNVNPTLARKYFRRIPEARIPISGSEGAIARKQQLEKQFPVHDIEPKHCHDLTSEEIQNFEDYITAVKEHVAGQGVVTEIEAADFPAPPSAEMLDELASLHVGGGRKPGHIHRATPYYNTEAEIHLSQKRLPHHKVSGGSASSSVNSSPRNVSPSPPGHEIGATRVEGAIIRGQSGSHEGATLKPPGFIQGQVHRDPEGIRVDKKHSHQVRLGGSSASSSPGSSPGLHRKGGHLGHGVLLGQGAIHGEVNRDGGRLQGHGDVIAKHHHDDNNNGRKESHVRDAGVGDNRAIHDPRVGSLITSGTQTNAKVRQCEQCKVVLKPGDVAILADRAGKNKMWHPQCFKCHTCQELLVDLLYYYDSGKVFCARDYAKYAKIPRCGACDELIFAAEYTGAENAAWHIRHFCCYECDRPLAGHKYIPVKGQPHCLPCYQSKHGKKCKSCGEYINPEEQRVSLDADHWHATANCFRCAVCSTSLLGRKMTKKDDMILCSSACRKRSIQMTTAEIRARRLPLPPPSFTSQPPSNSSTLV